MYVSSVCGCNRLMPGCRLCPDDYVCGVYECLGWYVDVIVYGAEISEGRKES